MVGEKEIRATIDYIRVQAIHELEQQGHYASGALADIDIKIEKDYDGYSAFLIMEDYAEKIDKGGFKTGDFATMLRWVNFIHPEWSEPEKTQLAFSTSQKVAYMRGSADWSNNGRRKGWMKWAIDNTQDEWEDLLNLGVLIDSAIDAFVKSGKV